MTGAPFERLGQLAGLVLQAGLDLPESPDAALLGQGELALVLATALLVGLGLLDDLVLPLGERLELVADPGELLDGELLLGVAAGLLEVLLGLLQVGEGLLLFLVGLFALVLVHVALGLGPSGRRRSGRPARRHRR